jgi:type IV secretory pathway VirB2 component (pilin)
MIWLGLAFFVALLGVLFAGSKTARGASKRFGQLLYGIAGLLAFLGVLSLVLG